METANTHFLEHSTSPSSFLKHLLRGTSVYATCPAAFLHCAVRVLVLRRRVNRSQVETMPWPCARAARDETRARTIKGCIAIDAAMRYYRLGFIHSTEVSRVVTIPHVGQSLAKLGTNRQCPCVLDVPY